MDVRSITAGMSKCGDKVETTSVHHDTRYFHTPLRQLVGGIRDAASRNRRSSCRSGSDVSKGSGKRLPCKKQHGGLQFVYSELIRCFF